MPPVAELELPTLDPADPELRGARFHQQLAELVRHSWLARTALGVIVLDREVALEMLRDRRMSFPAVELIQLQGINDGPVFERVANGLLAQNGEAHARLRRLLTPAFTPAAVERLRPGIHDHAARLWDAVAEDGGCDFVSALARRLPSMVIADLLGAPGEHERMASYSEHLQSIFDPTLLAGRAALEAVYMDAYHWIEELVDARRRHPGDDLASALVAAEAEGDRLSHDECVSLIASVISGGTDTTQAQLAHGMRLFCEHPEQWQLLARDPSLAAAAANEVVRFEPITPFTARLVREETTYRDVVFPAGTVVFLCSATANRDPAVFSEPETFDITTPRPPGAVLTFGNGPHLCPGAHLARAELTELYGFLAPRMSDPVLAEEPVLGAPVGIYPVESLKISFTARGGPS
ncbi:MAG TPA: cytochrome P450 [Acidimicrobiales bacterium]|nr:cytochrome P450 [Acidimicrobiales bacterium]